MQKEPLSRITQDADTAVFEMEVCPHVSGVSWLLMAQRKSSSPFSLACVLVVTGGGQEEAGSDIWVWQRDLLRREFVVIALTDFRAVNDSGLSATNLSACLLFTKLLFYGPVQGAAACLSTDQEIISVKHWFQWCSPTEKLSSTV